MSNIHTLSNEFHTIFTDTLESTTQRHDSWNLTNPLHPVPTDEVITDLTNAVAQTAKLKHMKIRLLRNPEFSTQFETGEDSSFSPLGGGDAALTLTPASPSLQDSSPASSTVPETALHSSLSQSHVTNDSSHRNVSQTSLQQLSLTRHTLRNFFFLSVPSSCFTVLSYFAPRLSGGGVSPLALSLTISNNQ
mmetsp:Transcript_18004/g.37468  ORF Transcript_18004/g.37468 Transcript_18004/m.37468 type:complete len:191 (+) Transcript_18004:1949-2521(+)